MKSIPGGNYILKKGKTWQTNVRYTIYLANFIKYEYCNEK